MHAGTVTFTLNMPAVFREEFGWIVGEFPTLGVASQGRTREEAERNLIEAAQLFFESCFERNRLDEALKELGFTPGNASDRPQGDHLTVPVELMSPRNGSSSHAR
jgi:predicted RNase H-like HicB family nuclease